MLFLCLESSFLVLDTVRVFCVIIAAEILFGIVLAKRGRDTHCSVLSTPPRGIIKIYMKVRQIICCQFLSESVSLVAEGRNIIFLSFFLLFQIMAQNKVKDSITSLGYLTTSEEEEDITPASPVKKLVV